MCVRAISQKDTGIEFESSRIFCFSKDSPVSFLSVGCDLHPHGRHHVTVLLHQSLFTRFCQKGTAETRCFPRDLIYCVVSTVFILLHGETVDGTKHTVDLRGIRPQFFTMHHINMQKASLMWTLRLVHMCDFLDDLTGQHLVYSDNKSQDISF